MVTGSSEQNSQRFFRIRVKLRPLHYKAERKRCDLHVARKTSDVTSLSSRECDFYLEKSNHPKKVTSHQMLFSRRVLCKSQRLRSALYTYKYIFFFPDFELECKQDLKFKIWKFSWQKKKSHPLALHRGPTSLNKHPPIRPSANVAIYTRHVARKTSDVRVCLWTRENAISRNSAANNCSWNLNLEKWLAAIFLKIAFSRVHKRTLR